MNELLMQTEQMARGYMILLYLIVLGITATVIVNTLIMSVFERTREIGILAAIGMKAWRIMAMFFIESGLLAVGGIVMGLILGGLLVVYFHECRLLHRRFGHEHRHAVRRTIYAYLTVQDTITPDHHRLYHHPAGSAVPGRAGGPHGTR